MAKEAGMRYIVITAKHHEGFAMFPSAASSWNVVEATPYKKDLIGPLVAAARSERLKMGLYYSQSQDWINPGGSKGPKNTWKEGEGWDEAHKGDFDQYLKQVSLPQVKELLTRYQPDILWWDTPLWMTPERAKPFHDLLSLRPGIITNNRLGGGYDGDTSTPEQHIPADGIPGDWETCMTMSSKMSWGYNASDKNWKSSKELIQKLATICSLGGNLLLNVGPMATGEFPPEAIERLHDIGDWMKINSESIYGTTKSPFPAMPWGCATLKGDRLYLHVFEWPKDGNLRVPIIQGVKSGWLVSNPNSPLQLTPQAEQLTLTLPATAPDTADSVIVLALEGELKLGALPPAKVQEKKHKSAQP